MKQYFVGLVLAVFISSCGLTDTEGPSLALSITAEPSTLIDPALGGKVIFTAVNTSGENLEIETSGGCLLELDVIDPDGEPVTRGVGCVLETRLVTIFPGEVRTAEFRIGRYRESHRTGADPFVPWKPGTYTASGFVLIPGASRTKPVEFKLLCRPELRMKC